MPIRMERLRSWRCGLSVVAMLAFAMPVADAQDTVSVMVDESATAAQLLDRLRDQRADNLAEGARLADRLLREFSDRLVPASTGDPDLFRAVRLEIESLLRDDPELAAAYADIASFRAARLLDAGDLEQVHRTALWTPAGLEATLRMAQLDAEAGLGHRAIRRLERLEGHPGLADAASAARRDRLRELSRWVAEGEGVDTFGPWPGEERSDSPLEAAVDPLPDETWSELWREPLAESPYERAFRELRRSGRPVPRTADRVVADGSLLVVMPAADDDLVYVNEGHVVRAIDRLSRRERWRTPIDGAGGQGLGAIGDPTLVRVGGDRVVTLSGHALGNQRTGSGRVVCLDRETGRLLWATDLAEVSSRLVDDPGADDLFPYGVVALGEDVAVVMARRVTNRLETIDSLAAIELEDGRVRWLVPLGSCGGVRLGGTRPYASPVAADGRVLVNASVGIVASVDAADGSVEWLRREPVPLRDGRYSAEPWEISQPLLVGDRVFTVAPDQSALLELDARTGTSLARHDGAAIEAAQPRYLLGASLDDRPIVLAVGSDLVAYDADDLETPRWRYAERNEALLAGDPGVANRNGIRGRVQVVGDVLLVPGGEALRVVDLETGRVRRTLEWGEAANVMSTAGQIVFADKDSIASVMVPDTARRRLSARRMASPDDPEWPIAIMDLEIACGHREAALEAAELARDAVERRGDAVERDLLFERLIDFDVMVRRDRELGQRVRDLLAAVAVEPGQRVRERLSRGDWHADRGEPAEAMEVWQTLLSDPGLAGQPVSDEARITTARVSARERMRDLARIAGDGLLAPSAALADLRVDRLLETVSDAEAEALLAVAREFPLAEAAHRARREAATRLEASGRGFDAMLARLAELRSRVDESPTLDRSATDEILVEFARAGRPDLKARLEASLDSGGDALPRLGRTPGLASEWRGRLVDAAPGVGGLGGTILLADDGEMRRLRDDGETLSVGWSVPIEDPNPTIVHAGPRLLVWQDADRRQPIAMSVEAETGEVAWLNPSVASLFPASRSGEALPQNGQRSIPGSTEIWRWDEVLPGMVEDLLVMVRRNGDIVALESDDGTTVRWTIENVVDVVQHVEHGPLGVLVAGESRRGDDDRTAPEIVLVAADGQVVRRWPLDEAVDREIRWIRQTPLGEVIWGTTDGVSRRGLMPGDGEADDRWSLRPPRLRESWQAWARPGRLVVRERSDRLGTWRTRDGRRVSDLVDDDLPGDAMFEQMLLAPDGKAAAIYGNRVVVLDEDGAKLGLDAVHEARNYLLGGLAEDGAVVLSFEGAGPVTGDDGTPRTEFTYAIYRFGIDDGGRQAGPALELRTLGPRFDSMRIREGWILLSSPASTVAIPLR